MSKFDSKKAKQIRSVHVIVPDELYDDIRFCSFLSGKSVTEIVREAIAAYIPKLKKEFPVESVKEFLRKMD